MIPEPAVFLWLIFIGTEGIVVSQLFKYIRIIPADRQLSFSYFHIVIGEGCNFLNGHDIGPVNS